MFGGANMAFDAYIKISGVNGESGPNKNLDLELNNIQTADTSNPVQLEPANEELQSVQSGGDTQISAEQDSIETHKQNKFQDALQADFNATYDYGWGGMMPGAGGLVGDGRPLPNETEMKNSSTERRSQGAADDPRLHKLSDE
jgi:hypothetical protein